MTFRYHGISNDEEVQHVYGRLLLDFYGSGLQDMSAFHYKNLYLYGGMFDLIAAILEKFASQLGLLPYDLQTPDIWQLRHLISALFGLAAIALVYRIGKTLASASTGLVAMCLLTLTACWTGAMFTHTKDIPFATCMLWAIERLICIAPNLPRPPLMNVLQFGLAVGCAMGLRVGGAFAVIYCVLLIALLTLTQDSLAQAVRFCYQSVLALIPAGLLAFVCMGLFWPWSVMGYNHLLQAVHAFSDFSFNMFTEMHGHTYAIGDVPNTYLLQYLFVRLPELVLLGLLLWLLLSLGQGYRYFIHARIPEAINDRSVRAHLVVITAAVVPILFTLVDAPTLYNGVRHFSFVVPPLILLAALGLTTAYNAIHRLPVRSAKPLACAFVLIITVLALPTLALQVRLHPYNYVAYNRFGGNIAQAIQHWEGDYWSSSTQEMALQLNMYANQQPDTGQPWLVAICAESIQGSAYLNHHFRVTKDWNMADFFISTTHMHCDQVLQGTVIASVVRAGATLAVLKDRRQLHGDARKPRPAPTD